VARLDSNELSRLFGLGCAGWVLADAARVEGYLLGFWDDASYDGEEFCWFTSNVARPFLYVDQIAISVDARRKHIGTQLYDHVVQLGREMAVSSVCCEVNLHPGNPDSLRFHERQGFDKIGELETGDGRRVALLNRLLSSPSPAVFCALAT
jgi:predicted GNAT superfamily acetyltransferase